MLSLSRENLSSRSNNPVLLFDLLIGCEWVSYCFLILTVVYLIV
jgi:hypothetical protein